LKSFDRNIPAACALVAAALVLLTRPASAQDEVSLFNGSGRAVAYVATDDELTIYLWGGKPVAYLSGDSDDEFQVYGFNGKHLGWFVRGVIWDHSGNAACALKEAIQTTQYESYKGFKQYKPYKGYKQFAPFRPAFSNSFGEIPCEFLLGAGGE